MLQRDFPKLWVTHRKAAPLLNAHLRTNTYGCDNEVVEGKRHVQCGLKSIYVEIRECRLHRHNGTVERDAGFQGEVLFLVLP